MSSGSSAGRIIGGSVAAVTSVVFIIIIVLVVIVIILVAVFCVNRRKRGKHNVFLKMYCHNIM